MSSLKSMGIPYYIATEIHNPAPIDRAKSNNRTGSDKQLCEE